MMGDREKQWRIRAKAPCRLDLGGTLDLVSFSLPLQYAAPLTFNAAVDLFTTVSVSPYTKGRIRITSSGIGEAEFDQNQLPFDHPLGLMLAAVSFFNISGLSIQINSTSPPQSGLGGSSVALTALIGALSHWQSQTTGDRPMDKRRIALLGHQLECAVTGKACGIQDHLAAAYGGVNAWHWQPPHVGDGFRREQLVGSKQLARTSRSIAAAYVGVTHESLAVNQQWVSAFKAGRFRDHWLKIIDVTRKFAAAFAEFDFTSAARYMNAETELRLEMTPDVLTPLGKKLWWAAKQLNCGARFTGAGAGGCVWAVGPPENMDKLAEDWQKALSAVKTARWLPIQLDGGGLQCESEKTD